MNRFLSILVPLALYGMSSNAYALSCKEIVKMHSYNMPKEIIITTMETSGSTFDAEEVTCLEKNNMPKEIIEAAAKTSAQNTGFSKEETPKESAKSDISNHTPKESKNQQIDFAQIKRIAVLEFRGVSIKNQMLLDTISDNVRGRLVRHINTKKYIVMTKENIDAVLKDMGQDASCIEGECEVEIARNIGADFVISGVLGKIEGFYVGTIKLHETENAALLYSKQIRDKSALSLVDQFSLVVDQMVSESNL